MNSGVVVKQCEGNGVLEPLRKAMRRTLQAACGELTPNDLDMLAFAGNCVELLCENHRKAQVQSPQEEPAAVEDPCSGCNVRDACDEGHQYDDSEEDYGDDDAYEGAMDQLADANEYIDELEDKVSTLKTCLSKLEAELLRQDRVIADVQGQLEIELRWSKILKNAILSATS